MLYHWKWFCPILVQKSWQFGKHAAFPMQKRTNYGYKLKQCTQCLCHHFKTRTLFLWHEKYPSLTITWKHISFVWYCSCFQVITSLLSLDIKHICVLLSHPWKYAYFYLIHGTKRLQWHCLFRVRAVSQGCTPVALAPIWLGVHFCSSFATGTQADCGLCTPATDNL